MRRTLLMLGFSSLTLAPGCQCSQPPVQEPGSVTPTPPPTVDDRRTRQQHMDTLRAGVGKNLSELDEDQRGAIQTAVCGLVPGRDYDRVFDYRPEQVWDVRQPDDTALVVLLEKIPYVPHPGSTPVRMTAFDKFGMVVTETKFTTGHRCYLRDAAWEQSVDGIPLFVLHTRLGGGPGPDVGRQVYALVGGRFDLVRLEDSDGAVTRNRYYVRHFTCGPDTGGRTAAEWEADLFSNDRLRVLRALVWLGGWHWDHHPDDKPESQHEDFAEVRMVRELRAKRAIIDRLAELCKSDDPWIRDAAELARKPEDARF